LRSRGFGDVPAELKAALSHFDGPQGGRPLFNPVMPFKIPVLRRRTIFPPERTAFLIDDRLSDTPLRAD
jgi:hypothetical protein